MEPIQIGLIVSGILLVLVVLGMRVAFAAGLSGLVGLIWIFWSRRGYDPEDFMWALGVAVQPAAGLAQGARAGRRGARLCLTRLLAEHALHLAGVARQQLVAVGDHSFQRLRVGHRAHLAPGQARWCLLDLGQAQPLQRADVDPADVELVGLDREPGRGRVGMVVVVQFLATDDQAPGRDVGGGVLRLEIAVAPVMAQAVDHAGGPERNPHHLQRPHGQARQSEQQHVDDEHERHAPHRAAVVQVALQPVVRRAVAVAGQRFGVLRLGAVQLGALPQHLADAVDLRAVRVFGLLAFGVVLAVDRRPGLGGHAGGHPQPEAEEMRRDGVQIERPVGGMAVQVDGDTGDGDVRQRQREQQHLPPRPAQQAVGQKIKQGAIQREITESLHCSARLQERKWVFNAPARVPVHRRAARVDGRS